MPTACYAVLQSHHGLIGYRASLSRRSPIDLRCHASLCSNRKAEVLEHPRTETNLEIKTLAQRLFVGSVAAAFVMLSPLAGNAVTENQLVYLDAWRAVDRAYVDKGFNGQNWFKMREKALKEERMTTREETYVAIRKLLATLNDPFTRFLEPEQYAILRGSTSGSVTGIGVEVSFAAERGFDSPLVVISPSPGGPAERAGIKPGDEILEIDGRSTSELSLYAAGNLLQGPEGSSVTLRIRPHGNGRKSPKDITFVREVISLNPVDKTLCDIAHRAPEDRGNVKEKIGFIRVSTFNKQTPAKFHDALEELHSQGMTRLILDMRNNGGGYFPAGIEVARMLIDQGNIVLVADADGIRDEYEATHAEDSSTPLTVLVNRGTASASEVVAGALKDSGRGRVIGERTFGKGLIQTLVRLTDGSAVAVTVAKYQTPSGVDINKVGIEPDATLSAEELAEIPLGAKGFCNFIENSTAIPL